MWGVCSEQILGRHPLCEHYAIMTLHIGIEMESKGNWSKILNRLEIPLTRVELKADTVSSRWYLHCFAFLTKSQISITFGSDKSSRFHNECSCGTKFIRALKLHLCGNHTMSYRLSLVVCVRNYFWKMQMEDVLWTLHVQNPSIKQLFLCWQTFVCGSLSSMFKSLRLTLPASSNLNSM